MTHEAGRDIRSQDILAIKRNESLKHFLLRMLPSSSENSQGEPLVYHAMWLATILDKGMIHEGEIGGLPLYVKFAFLHTQLGEDAPGPTRKYLPLSYDLQNSVRDIAAGMTAYVDMTRFRDFQALQAFTRKWQAKETEQSASQPTEIHMWTYSAVTKPENKYTDWVAMAPTLPRHFRKPDEEQQPKLSARAAEKMGKRLEAASKDLVSVGLLTQEQARRQGAEKIERRAAVLRLLAQAKEQGQSITIPELIEAIPGATERKVRDVVDELREEGLIPEGALVSARLPGFRTEATKDKIALINEAIAYFAGEDATPERRNRVSRQALYEWLWDNKPNNRMTIAEFMDCIHRNRNDLHLGEPTRPLRRD